MSRDSNCQGCPAKGHLPLTEAHTEFNLTAEEFAEVGAEIVRALDFYEVPEREQQELMAAYESQHVRRRDGVGHNYDLRRALPSTSDRPGLGL